MSEKKTSKSQPKPQTYSFSYTSISSTQQNGKKTYTKRLDVSSDNGKINGSYTETLNGKQVKTVPIKSEKDIKKMTYIKKKYSKVG